MAPGPPPRRSRGPHGPHGPRTRTLAPALACWLAAGTAQIAAPGVLPEAYAYGQGYGYVAPPGPQAPAATTPEPPEPPGAAESTGPSGSTEPTEPTEPADASGPAEPAEPSEPPAPGGTPSLAGHPAGEGRPHPGRPAPEPPFSAPSAGPEPDTADPARIKTATGQEPETEPDEVAEVVPGTDIPSAAPSDTGRAATTRRAGAEAAPNASERRIPVLTLGVGLALMGLGIGFLGLRMRRR